MNDKISIRLILVIVILTLVMGFVIFMPQEKVKDLIDILVALASFFKVYSTKSSK